MRSFAGRGILQGCVSVQQLSDPPFNRVSTVFCIVPQTTSHLPEALILTKKSKISTVIKCLTRRTELNLVVSNASINFLLVLTVNNRGSVAAAEISCCFTSGAERFMVFL